MIKREDFKISRKPGIISGTTEFRCRLALHGSTIVSNLDPIDIADVESRLIDQGMRHLYGDIGKAIRECAVRVHLTAGVGCNHSAIDDAFGALSAAIHEANRAK